MIFKEWFLDRQLLSHPSLHPCLLQCNMSLSSKVCCTCLILRVCLGRVILVLVNLSGFTLAVLWPQLWAMTQHGEQWEHSLDCLELATGWQVKEAARWKATEKKKSRLWMWCECDCPPLCCGMTAASSVSSLKASRLSVDSRCSVSNLTSIHSDSVQHSTYNTGRFHSAYIASMCDITLFYKWFDPWTWAVIITWNKLNGLL